MEEIRKDKENVLRTLKLFMGHMDLAPVWHLVTQYLVSIGRMKVLSAFMLYFPKEKLHASEYKNVNIPS